MPSAWSRIDGSDRAGRGGRVRRGDRGAYYADDATMRENGAGAGVGRARLATNETARAGSCSRRRARVAPAARARVGRSRGDPLALRVLDRERQDGTARRARAAALARRPDRRGAPLRPGAATAQLTDRTLEIVFARATGHAAAPSASCGPRRATPMSTPTAIEREARETYERFARAARPDRRRRQALVGALADFFTEDAVYIDPAWGASRAARSDPRVLREVDGRAHRATAGRRPRTGSWSTAPRVVASGTRCSAKRPDGTP